MRSIVSKVSGMVAVFGVVSMLANAATSILAMPDGPGCDPTGSVACGVFVPASHPYRGDAR